MATEPERERAANGLGELDAPETASDIRLHETALGTEAMKVNRASLAAVDADRRQAIVPCHVRQAAAAALAAMLVLNG